MKKFIKKFIESIFSNYFEQIKDEKNIMIKKIQSATDELDGLWDEFRILQKDELGNLWNEFRILQYKLDESVKTICYMHENNSYLESLILKIKDCSSAIELEGEALELYSRCREIYYDDEAFSKNILDERKYSCSTKNFFLIKEMIALEENREHLEIIKKHIWLKAYLRYSPLSLKDENAKKKQQEANTTLSGLDTITGGTLADYYHFSGLECLLLEISSHNYFLNWENGCSYGYEELRGHEGPFFL